MKPLIWGFSVTVVWLTCVNYELKKLIETNFPYNINKTTSFHNHSLNYFWYTFSKKCYRTVIPFEIKNPNFKVKLWISLISRVELENLTYLNFVENWCKKILVFTRLTCLKCLVFSVYKDLFKNYSEWNSLQHSRK